jgi:hypothetical protein
MPRLIASTSRVGAVPMSSTVRAGNGASCLIACRRTRSSTMSCGSSGWVNLIYPVSLLRSRTVPRRRLASPRARPGNFRRRSCKTFWASPGGSTIVKLFTCGWINFLTPPFHRATYGPRLLPDLQTYVYSQDPAGPQLTCATKR